MGMVWFFVIMNKFKVCNFSWKFINKNYLIRKVENYSNCKILLYILIVLKFDGDIYIEILKFVCLFEKDWK